MSAAETTPAATSAAAPVVDTPAAAPAAAAAEPTSAVTAPESQPAAAEADTAAPTTADVPASTEEPVGKKEVEVTATPISAGTLGYKAPGLMNQLRFKKHYFWLGDETAIPHSELSEYLKSKDADKHTAAHSSHTGKGLLYYKEGESTKSKPTGIINLAQVDLNSLAKSGDKIFTFTANKGRHAFEASSADERNGWVVAIKSEAETSVAAKDSVQGSDNYKSALSHLEGPAAGAAVVGGAGAAGAAAASNDKTEPVEDSREAKKDSKGKSKDRSVSRKRQSIFGGLMGKKEDADAKKEEKAAEKEAKKEEKEVEKKQAAAEKEVAKEEKNAEKEAKKEEKADAKAEAAQAEAAEHGDKKELSAAAAAGVAAAAGTEEANKNSAKTDKASKRGSVFGSFFNKNSPSVEKKQEDVVPAIDENAAPATTEAVAGEPKAEEAGLVGATGVVPAAAATETATTPTKPADEKRRSSFFGLGSNKKEKKAAEEPKSEAAAAKDSETAEVAAAGAAAKEEDKKEKKSPLDFIRRKTKSGSKDAPKSKGGVTADPLPKAENAHPSTIEAAKNEAAERGEEITADGVHPVTDATTGATTATETSKVNGTNSAIGDVVPEAVTVGEKPATETNAAAPVQATA